MYFKATYRHNPKTDKSDWYFRLVESYRNVLDEVRQRTVLSVGFLSDFSGDQIDLIEKGICNRITGQQSLFEDAAVTTFVEALYQRMIREKKVDLGTADPKKDIDTVDLNTLKNKDVREMGAEWMSLQAVRELGIDRYLASRGWSDEDVSLALSHIVSRAVYPASELKTVRFMEDNSSICELTGYDIDTLTKDKLYGISKKLFAEKQGLENYLSKKTNNLFDLQDEIILYDLTNSYFEGEKRGSQLARYGRSKEKRSDCPLVVLALVVNVEGFIKHSSIFQGNMSDSNSLCQIIDHLRISTSTSSKRAIVVIDAGIATEENLALIQAKGYDYVCVSRSTKAAIKQAQTGKPVIVNDRKNREITLEKVLTNNDSAYYMKVTSPTKALKERAMKTLFEQRFEDGLECIKASLTKKSGVKTYEKVLERIGRLKQKYSSAHGRYKIEVEKQAVPVSVNSKSKSGKTKEICTALKWEKNTKLDAQKQEECGVYFLRTCIKTDEETLIWTVYNCIRNVESSFRTLKTDLDLRPIFHKSDDATQAHLQLGLLAYSVVNTVRYKLKQKDIKSEWREIVRVMNTQKCVTTVVQNTREQWISIRKCSEPEDKVKRIYDALKYKYAPFIRKKSVVPKPQNKKNEVAENYKFMDG
ncbi:MAG: IS1634 family transposase [Paludibacter sp.]|nr:IS1634 family transposase [Paludibacter sp.]